MVQQKALSKQEIEELQQILHKEDKETIKQCISYCRPPEFTVMFLEKYSAGGSQSGCAVNLIGVQLSIDKR